MFYENLADRILFDHLSEGMDELYILASYATPNMLSWYIKNIEGRAQSPIKISLTIGMVPFDNLSIGAHEGFKGLEKGVLPNEISSIRCSYATDPPAEHANLYIWCKNSRPQVAYTGSAPFVQSAFIGLHRRELMSLCDADGAMEYYKSVVPRTIYCTHSEIEEYVALYPSHPVLDMEYNVVRGLEDYEYTVLSLVTKSGEPGVRSGLNWGQRSGREPNQAYIPLPAEIARSGFFPLEKRHFTAITDDRHQLTLRVEQENDKAITTPVRNSDLGEYFRNRLGLPNGAPVTRADLDRYGRTDVKFVKFDEETFYMDFSSQFRR